MTTQEKKLEISKIMDEVPETILEEILSYLKEFRSLSEEEQKRQIALKRILVEKRSLLLRLAQ